MLILSLAPAASSQTRTSELRRHQEFVFRSALEKIAPCVVRIETVGGALPVERSQDGADDRIATAGFRQADGPTTGVIWSTDGFIYTSSFNFVRDPAIITVSLHDGRRFVARLVARDRAARLALLKIDANDLSAPSLVPRDTLRPGQWTLAAGFGHGSQAPTVSVGILSAVARTSGLTVQTDAKISPANYGGPLFDVEGNLIGVCVPNAGRNENELAGVEWYDSGIGFAVCTEILERRFPYLREGRDSEQGLLGILTSADEPIVGQEFSPGVRIEDVAPGPADDAGLKAGDLIIAIDGAPIHKPLDLKRSLALRVAGDKIILRVLRDGDPGDFTATLVRSADLQERIVTSRPASTPALLPSPSEPPSRNTP